MDLDHIAEVYSIMRNYIADADIDNVALDVVEHLLDSGYSAAQIEEACTDHREIFVALDELTTYTNDDMEEEDEYLEEDEEDEEDENEEELEYYDEE